MRLSDKAKRIGRMVSLNVILFAMLVLFLLCMREIGDVVEYINQKNIDVNIRNIVINMGWRGVIASVLLQAFFVISFVLPSVPLQMFVGYVYPPIVAISICMVGVAVGSVFFFLVIRLAGERITRSISAKKKGNTFNKLISVINQNQSNLIYLTACLYLIPVLPYGLICALLGNSKIRTWKFGVTCFLTCSLDVVVNSALGRNVHKGQWMSFAVLAVVLLAIIIIFAVNKDKILDKVVKVSARNNRVNTAQDYHDDAKDEQD